MSKVSSHIHWQMRKPELGSCKIVVQSKNWLKIKFFVDFDTIASLSSVSSFTDRQEHVFVCNNITAYPEGIPTKC